MAPVLGSTRVILPTALSVTYSAPSGPTVLPMLPCRPVTRRETVASPEDAAALATDGATIAVKAAANTNSFRMKPIELPVHSRTIPTHWSAKITPTALYRVKDCCCGSVVAVKTAPIGGVRYGQ